MYFDLFDSSGYQVSGMRVLCSQLIVAASLLVFVIINILNLSFTTSLFLNTNMLIYFSDQIMISMCSVFLSESKSFYRPPGNCRNVPLGTENHSCETYSVIETGLFEIWVLL